jgi:hypothetical protein
VQPVKVERTRENLFALTVSATELSALVAAARMTHDALKIDPAAPAEALDLLRRLLADIDAALARAGGPPASQPDD